jgi:hypothetical protein
MATISGVLDAEILQTIVEMPEPLKIELLHYAKYLIDNHSKDFAQERTAPKKRRAGILKGTFVLPLPENFDEPLEDFKEYM